MFNTKPIKPSKFHDGELLFFTGTTGTDGTGYMGLSNLGCYVYGMDVLGDVGIIGEDGLTLDLSREYVEDVFIPVDGAIGLHHGDVLKCIKEVEGFKLGGVFEVVPTENPTGINITLKKYNTEEPGSEINVGLIEGHFIVVKSSKLPTLSGMTYTIHNKLDKLEEDVVECKGKFLTDRMSPLELWEHIRKMEELGGELLIKL